MMARRRISGRTSKWDFLYKALVVILLWSFIKFTFTFQSIMELNTTLDTLEDISQNDRTNISDGDTPEEFSKLESNRTMKKYSLNDVSNLTVISKVLGKSVKFSFIELNNLQYFSYVNALCENEKNFSRVDMVCSCFPQNLRGLNVPNITNLELLSWPEVIRNQSVLSSGGEWRPDNCFPRRRVAVIIPYRDRERHLLAFLAHTHPILQRQQLHYRIFVVEQNLPYKFNKGAMMNIGFLEAMKMFSADCVVFHDVDLLMENDNHIMMCGEIPFHFGAYISKTKYRPQYGIIYGGAVGMTPDQFRFVNGYSNLFFGWGGEDDDFSARVRYSGLKIARGPANVARYTVWHHGIDAGNKPSKDGPEGRGLKFKKGSNWMDGLNTTMYHIKEIKSLPLYTWIHADLLSTPETKSHFVDIGNYISRRGYCPISKHHRRPNGQFSPVTCQYMCQTSSSCVAVEYHHDNNQMSYCFLVNVLCDNIIDSSTVTLYLKMSLKT